MVVIIEDVNHDEEHIGEIWIPEVDTICFHVELPTVTFVLHIHYMND